MESSKMKLVRIVVKTFLFLLGINILYILLQPLPLLSKLSLYNSVFPGRERFQFGETAQLSYSFTTSNLDALFASHEILGSSEDDFKVFVIGNSTVWGHYLTNQQTLTGILNRESESVNQSLKIKYYNLGYPSISVAQDLLILQQSLKYDPDLIIWLFSLEGFPKNKHFSSALGAENQVAIASLFPSNFLEFPNELNPSLWEKSIFGQRKELNDLIRIQFYGPMWSGTQIDHFIPDEYTLRANDLEDDNSFYTITPENFSSDLSINVYFETANDLAGDIPIIFINQPIFIADGKNSDIRYNFFYPKWAYDTFREELDSLFLNQPQNYFDLWNAVDNKQFTNTAVHLTPTGMSQLANEIKVILNENNFLTP